MLILWVLVGIVSLTFFVIKLQGYVNIGDAVWILFVGILGGFFLGILEGFMAPIVLFFVYIGHLSIKQDFWNKKIYIRKTK